jgi:hypothetical protein
MIGGGGKTTDGESYRGVIIRVPRGVRVGRNADHELWRLLSQMLSQGNRLLLRSSKFSL